MRSTFFLLFFCIAACDQKQETDSYETSIEKENMYIRTIDGEDEELDQNIIKRGEVLISYSDCAECHKPDKRSKGPGFLDIAKRYPAKQVYIDLLARKVISGGTGSWGNPIMSPHPDLDEMDAKSMVSFILSLEE